MCSALYCVIHATKSRQLPCGGWYEGFMPDAHYPINFVVKHQCLLSKARPEAVETCRMLPACLLIGVICFLESKQMAAIRKQ
jgi:hypothetical protein